MLGVKMCTKKVHSSHCIYTIEQLANAYPDLIQTKLGKTSTLPPLSVNSWSENL